MKESKNTSAIILQNTSFRERDSLVSVYSKEYGRLNLVARGTKTPKSKMRGHIEPFTSVKIMVVKGKRWDYLGAVVTENAFLNIREDYEKILLTAKVLNLYLEYVKEDEKEDSLFELLLSFLEFVDQNKISRHELFYSFFQLKFLLFTGLSPELDTYLDTKKKIVEKKHCFDLSAGGLVEEKSSKYCLNISVDTIKVLRLALSQDFKAISKVSISERLSKEIKGIVSAFFDYNMKY